MRSGTREGKKPRRQYYSDRIISLTSITEESSWRLGVWPSTTWKWDYYRKKIRDGVYTHRLAGYIFFATDMPIRHRVGVAVFYRTPRRFSVEEIQQFWTNVIIFNLVTGEQRWYIVGCYLTLNYALYIDSAVDALGERPCGSELLVTGDFNNDLTGPKGVGRYKEIAVALTAAGLEDMFDQFLLRQCPWCRYRRTKSMVRLGREVRSWMDYFMGTDPSYLQECVHPGPQAQLG